MNPEYEPLTFSQKVLPNGIATYHSAYQAGFTTVKVCIALGSGHNHGELVPGAVHFLEHGMFMGSKLHPEPKQFEKLVTQCGGSLSATTYPADTVYTLSAPNSHFEMLLEGFYSMLFEPLFPESEVEREKSIIANERKGKERWFPGASEVGHYLETQFRATSLFTLREILGDDEDRSAVTGEYLHSIHRYYRIPGMYVMSVGGIEPGALYKRLAKLTINQEPPKFVARETEWIDRSYREIGFRDVSRYEYVWQLSISEKPDRKTRWQLKMLMEYLFDTSNGPIYHWLRHEKGWVYGIHYQYGVGALNKGYEIRVVIPFSDMVNLPTARAELLDRIQAALADDEAITLACERYANGSPYWYQKVSDVLGTAMDRLDRDGEIYPMSEVTQYVATAAEKGVMRKLWQEWVLDRLDCVGEILVVPKAE